MHSVFLMSPFYERRVFLEALSTCIRQSEHPTGNQTSEKAEKTWKGKVVFLFNKERLPSQYRCLEGSPRDRVSFTYEIKTLYDTALQLPDFLLHHANNLVPKK